MLSSLESLLMKEEILKGPVSVPRDTDVSGGEESAQVKAANERGYRDLILATKTHC